MIIHEDIAVQLHILLTYPFLVQAKLRIVWNGMRLSFVNQIEDELTNLFRFRLALPLRSTLTIIRYVPVLGREERRC